MKIRGWRSEVGAIGTEKLLVPQRGIKKTLFWRVKRKNHDTEGAIVCTIPLFISCHLLTSVFPFLRLNGSVRLSLSGLQG